MQLRVVVSPVGKEVKLDFNYYHKFSCAMYGKIEAVSPEFCHELHDGEHRSKIKLWALAPLNSKFTHIDKANQSIVIHGSAEFTISSPWPELLNNLGRGLTLDPELKIGNQRFMVMGTKMMRPPKFTEEMTWQPVRNATIAVSWSERGEKFKKYFYPTDKQCSELLAKNLFNKWLRLKEIRPDIADAFHSHDDAPLAVDLIKVTLPSEFREKKHQVKKSFIRSWSTNQIKLEAPIALQRLAWASGLGEHNAQGFGLIQEAEQC